MTINMILTWNMKINCMDYQRFYMHWAEPLQRSECVVHSIVIIQSLITTCFVCSIIRISHTLSIFKCDEVNICKFAMQIKFISTIFERSQPIDFVTLCLFCFVRYLLHFLRSIQVIGHPGYCWNYFKQRCCTFINRTDSERDRECERGARSLS